MNHVDLNNIVYAQGLARILIEHMENLPNDKCSRLSADKCKTCAFIRTWHDLGTLEYIITLLDVGYFEYEEWWDVENQQVDMNWLKKRWFAFKKPALTDAN